MLPELKEKMQKKAQKLKDIFDDKFEKERNLMAGDVSNWIKETYEEAAQAMYDELKPVVEWVSVKERLPEADGWYLCKRSPYHIPAVEFFYTKMGFFSPNRDITHYKKIEL